MSQFLFQGDFRRKPHQTLGGNSRVSEDRQALIQRAEAERNRRERERLEHSALLKIQAFFKACLERKRMRTEWMSEFEDKKTKGQLTDQDLFFQIYRLNMFFQHRKEDDVHKLLELGKILLTKYQIVTEAMKRDKVTAFAMKQVIQKCFRCLNTPHVPNAVLLRLIETYTDPSKYEDSESDVVSQLIVNIWMFLVEEANLFASYRKFLEAKIPPMQNETEVNRITQSYDYLLVYKRVLGLKSGLKNKNIQVTVKSRNYNLDSAMDIIMSKFAHSFSENVIPLEGNKGIAAYFILPRVCSFVPWEGWVKAVSLFKFMGKGGDGSGVRHIFYTTLILVRNMELNEDGVQSLLQIVIGLLQSIDPSFAPIQYVGGLTKHLEDVDEDMDYEDEEEIHEVSYKPLNTTYFQECQMIYKSLKSILNKPQIAAWLCPFQLKKWLMLTKIVSCIMRLEPKLSCVDFTYLSALSYRREFMRALCLYLIGESDLSEDDILAFCWFFSHLAGTLHDAEFLSALPISKEELGRIIILFRDRFCERILKDNDWKSAAPTINGMTGILMRLHDRNTRMNLFSEDIFISTMISKICPVESHSLKFENLTSDRTSDLSPIEDKLLKILKDFPFVLSFHDRVKVWNRLLDLDKQVNDPTPMVHRGEVQVRRNFIYEDAFEKLSPENVPDMRRHIRISLVNVVGVMEAGIDGGGLLREFLTESTKAAVDPNRGLFRFDSQNRIYPNPIAKKLMSDFRKHFFVVGRLVGKALYEQTLLELPIAAFFIQYCIDGKVMSSVDFLATLDPALHKNLLALKTFRGDMNSLGLDFTLAVDELGQTRAVELKRNGKDISVDNSNVIEYIHLVSDYKINKEMEDECRSFRAGMMDVVPNLRMFSWKELQTLISGSDKPIDIDDWRANTNYGPEFSDSNVTVQMFWQVVRSFDEKCLRMLLKFVTSCSRPPLLGFKDLVPKFGLQSAGKTDRLPTASTCMNLLKLPEFTDMNTMKEKLIYVINAHAGFELS